MNDRFRLLLHAPAPARRRFVQGLAAGGVLAGLPGCLQAAMPSPQRVRTGPAPVLGGSEITLVVAESLVNFTGEQRMATTINGSIPAPTLRLRQGELVTIRVTNNLRESTSIHWHGIILPYQMDGVPGISFGGIKPGETFSYRFRLQQTGTYWYHSHSGHQEQTGMYGAIIVEPRDGETIRAESEQVVLLSDWTDEDPGRVLRKLKQRSDYYNRNRPTLGEFLQEASTQGWGTAVANREMWNQMRMSPTDLADLSAATLTYLMNGCTPAGNWTGLLRRGERLRLRFINGAANTFYDVRIPGLSLTVVQIDGVDVEAVTVDEFRFGPGETCDVIVTPRDEAYTVFAQAMDRSGYARGTLAEREGLQAPVPQLDAAEWLSMGDMMGSMTHGGADHGSMDHSKMTHGTAAAASTQSERGEVQPLARPGSTVRHARSEYGPGTDMRVDAPRSNLDDPGVGLRNNGRRVLTLADLATIGGPLDPRGPGREIELHLTGNMERYSWSLDGLSFGHSTPVKLNRGERLRIILHNDTMMTHPMHLHGMWSELETPEGRFQLRRHTLPVQPAQRISFLVHADAPGRWAWHCHLMLHMMAGMFREVVVA